MIENSSKIKEFCTIHREFVLRVCLTLPWIKFYLFSTKEIKIDYNYFAARIRYRRLLLVVCLVLTYCWLDGILCKKFYFNAYRRLFYAKVVFYFVTCHRLLYAKKFYFIFSPITGYFMQKLICAIGNNDCAWMHDFTRDLSTMC